MTDSPTTMRDDTARGDEPRVRLVRNQAKCLDCGDTVVSLHRHDFVTCSCGALSVDGGTTYARRLFRDGARVEELSIYTDAAPSAARHQLEHSDVVLYQVHAPEACYSERCVIHSMSDHPLRTYEQVWAGGRMWRRCSHDELHPDPDEFGLGTAITLTHGCCPEACCTDAYDSPTAASLLRTPSSSLNASD